MENQESNGDLQIGDEVLVTYDGYTFFHNQNERPGIITKMNNASYTIKLFPLPSDNEETVNEVTRRDWTFLRGTKIKLVYKYSIDNLMDNLTKLENKLK